MKYRIRFEVFSHIINPPPPSLDVASFSPRGRDEYLIRLLSPRGRRMNRGPCQLIRSVRGGRDRVKKLWKTPLREPYFVHVAPLPFPFFLFFFPPPYVSTWRETFPRINMRGVGEIKRQAVPVLRVSSYE